MLAAHSAYKYANIHKYVYRLIANRITFQVHKTIQVPSHTTYSYILHQLS
jgi:hypothetical protein